MPAGDGTGPEGMGPMTGRGFGIGWGRGRWFRRGRGGEWGRGRFGYAPAWGAPPAKEDGFLKAQAEWLKTQLDAIGRCITELEQEELPL